MNKLLKRKLKSIKYSGFTLVETLVAISIFTVSILAMFSVITQGVSNTNYTKQKTIATYLAQEGIETVRNRRDTLVLYSPTSQDGWDEFNNTLFASGCAKEDGCFFDADNLFTSNNPMPITEIPFNGCNDSICSNGALLYGSTKSTIPSYNYTFGVPTGYTRDVVLQQLSRDETKVISTVTWTQGSGTYSVVFSENLFNWVE